MALFIDPIEALTAQDAAPGDRAALKQQHSDTLVVTLADARKVVLPAITSYAFTDDEIDAVWNAQTIVREGIADKDASTGAWTVIASLKALRKRVEKFYKDMRQPYVEVQKSVLALDGRDGWFVDTPHDDLERVIKAYDEQEAAREQAAREAEQARLDAIAKAERDAAAAAVARVAAQETQTDVRQALEREAENIQAAPVVAARAWVGSNRASVRGVGFTGWRYTGTIDDARKMDLVKDIIAGKVSLDAVLVNQKWVKGVVDQHKEETSKMYAYITVTKDRSTRG